MKILPFFNLVLILQAFFLPKIFWWQVPLGLIAFYVSFICLIFTKRRVAYALLCSLWLVINFCPTTSLLEQNTKVVEIQVGQKDHKKVELDLDNWELKFKADSSLEKLSEITDLQQKQGRVSVLKVRDAQNQEITVAAIELEGLLSGSKWASNKIFLRRLSSILRQEQGQVIVYMRAKGPYYLAVVRAFAFQARLNVIETENQLRHLSGFGSDMILRRN